MANFLLTLAPPDEMERWSLTTLRDEVVKIGAKVGFGLGPDLSADHEIGPLCGVERTLSL